VETVERDVVLVATVTKRRALTLTRAWKHAFEVAANDCEALSSSADSSV